MKEVVGNLVVTNLEKYLPLPSIQKTAEQEELGKAVNELSKRLPYQFNRVRRSVIDAYEGFLVILSDKHSVKSSSILAILSEKDPDLAKNKLAKFEYEAGLEEVASGSSASILKKDSLANNEDDSGKGESTIGGAQKTGEVVGEELSELDENQLTPEEKLKKIEMEKTATWWTKYYASKAKLVFSIGYLIDPDKYSRFFE